MIETPIDSTDGYTHEEFMAVSGLAPIPNIATNNKLPPVVYVQAISALAACRTLNEAMYWDNKADALAAWAKIYRDDKIGAEARALKLHAYRRIGQLAKELRQWRPAGRGKGSTGGARALLMEQGFSASSSCVITKIASVAQEKFDALVSLEKPPSPSVAVSEKLRENPEWERFVRALRCADSALNNTDYPALAKTLNAGQRQVAFRLISDMQDNLVSLWAAVKEAHQTRKRASKAA